MTLPHRLYLFPMGYFTWLLGEMASVIPADMTYDLIY